MARSLMQRLAALLLSVTCLAGTPAFAARGRGSSHRSYSSHRSRSYSHHSAKPRSSHSTNRNKVHVRGYTRKNGTHVAPHNRTAPNRTKRDNWSTRGNVNPETGKIGTKPPLR
jgi:hypothetical protein